MTDPTTLRYIPPASRLVEHALGVCYVSDTVKDKPCFSAIAYAGKARKNSFYESYRTADARDKRVAEFFAGLESRARAVEERRKQNTVPHTLKVGDVIYNSWGYDQTNIDFYVIVKTSSNYVWLQSIRSEGEETGFMCGNTRPVMPPEPYKRAGTGEPDPPEKHRVNVYENGQSVHFEFGCGSVYAGGDLHNSWYA